MKIDRMFGALSISSRGLTAQRKKMDSIASNLANVETTETPEGGPYKRKVVTFKERVAQAFSSVHRSPSIPLATTDGAHLSGDEFSSVEQQTGGGGIEAVEGEDSAGPKMVYDPGNPDADANGYVSMPNVNIVTEMVGMMSASRAFEANVVAINAAKNMAKDSLEI
jgi:flagellar basal-body rod protein FlgC